LRTGDFFPLGIGTGCHPLARYRRAAASRVLLSTELSAAGVDGASVGGIITNTARAHAGYVLLAVQRCQLAGNHASQCPRINFLSRRRTPFLFRRVKSGRVLAATAVTSMPTARACRWADMADSRRHNSTSRSS